MPIQIAELDRIKQATAFALVQALSEYTLTPEDIHKVGEATLAAIDRAASPDLDSDELAPGRRVNSLDPNTPEQSGTIQTVISTAGEVHTLMVKWDGWPGDEPVSPVQVELAR